ncbi:MAG: C10 family peptidase [Bacteroidaceae bacterium]|nr:C10 family peptidase [Bacteroidaceae bacterium]
MKKQLFNQRWTATLLLTVFTTSGVWADSVTAEQARQQALDFLVNQRTGSGKTRRAPGTTPQITQEKQVSGLYVFNVSDDGGFVIVSNDDRTVPVLGYSDSGSIDPDNIPANMKVWLQGYADEIAWLNRQGAQGAQGRQTAQSKQRVGNHSTNEIRPLLSTTWDQGWPYQAYCPLIDERNCVTGCVATAMAQVMNYHRWPTAPTTDIPSYYSYRFEDDMPSLTATTFDWANMKNSYLGNETDDTAVAVANLMRYCGCAVKMEYGLYSSEALTHNVATALTSYFGYKNTTKYVSRSYYAYANWVDLIYNELSQNRPVIYGASAVDNGHTFVCDGYKYENNTDLFHINWGWSGNSDGYFVLSALAPAQQYTGGSASASAYTFCQEAIVGIQPSTGMGSVLDVANTVNLAVNSITLNKNTAGLGETIDITVNVTNNSTDEFDGDIVFAVGTSAEEASIVYGANVVVAAGTTQNCVISYMPLFTGTANIYPLIADGMGGYTTFNSNIYATLTVSDATPANLAVSNLTSTATTIGWTAGAGEKWNLRYKPVVITEEDFENGLPNGWSIYDGDGDGYNWSLTDMGVNNSKALSSASFINEVGALTPQNWVITPQITFGGSFSFWARGRDNTYYEENFAVFISTDGSSFVPLSDDIVTTNTYTKYTFDLKDYSGTGYLAIIHYDCTDQFWLDIDDVTIVEPAGNWTTISDLTSNICAINGLTAETHYEVQVQTVFDEAVSGWSNPLIFTTLSTGPTDLASTYSGTAATISWKARASETAWNLRYRVRDASSASYDFNGEFGHSAVTGGWQPAHWQSFDGDKDGRNWAVSASNGRNGSTCFISNSNASTAQPANCLYTPMFTLGGSVSFWMYGQNEDLYAYLVDENGKYISIVKYSTTATSEWKQHSVNLSAYSGTGRLVFVHDSNGTLYLDDVTIYEPSAWTTVSSNVTNPYTITGLADNTTYGIQVQAVFSETSTSDWSDVLTFTTTVLELADDDSSLSTKNTTQLAAWEGITANATLANRTLYKDGNWNTLCLPFAICSFAGTPLEGATVKEMNTSGTSLDDNGKLTLQFTSATSIVAGKPYIVKWDKPAGYEGHESDYDILAPNFNAAVITSTTPTAVTSDDGKVTFVGQYSSFSVGDTGTGTFDGDLNEILLLSANSQIGYSKNPRTLRAFRAHFYVQAPASMGAKVRSFSIDFGDGDANGIIAVSADSVDANENVWYTPGGIRLNGKPTASGLYIHKGKKVIIK